MGSGKSTIGKRLAKQMNYAFIDSDHAIEKLHHKSIAQIFETDGEAHFRNLEKEWVQNFNQTNTVVSLGGGTPCFNDLMSLINSKGVTIYLNLPPKALLSRLLGAKTVRPLIETYRDKPEKLLEFIEQNLSEREVHYKQAQLEVDGLHVTVEQLMQLINHLPSSS